MTGAATPDEQERPDCRQCWRMDVTDITDHICVECRPFEDARVLLGDEYRTLHALWLAADYLFDAKPEVDFVARLDEVRSACQEAGSYLPYDRYHREEPEHG